MELEFWLLKLIYFTSELKPFMLGRVKGIERCFVFAASAEL
jgi:hypothetical protein